MSFELDSDGREAVRPYRNQNGPCIMYSAQQKLKHTQGSTESSVNDPQRYCCLHITFCLWCIMKRIWDCDNFACLEVNNFLIATRKVEWYVLMVPTHKLLRCVRKILKSDCLLRRVCLHGTTRLPLDGFSWNLVFESFYKICRENSSFVKMDKNKVLHMKTNKHFWLHLANFFLEWKMFQKKKKVVGKIKTHFWYNNVFFLIVPFMT